MDDNSKNAELRAELQHRPCLVGNRSFVQHGDELIDVAVARIAEPNHVRVRIDSRQYFDLLARYPKTWAAVKGARCVKLAVGDTIYEIHD